MEWFLYIRRSKLIWVIQCFEYELFFRNKEFSQVESVTESESCFDSKSECILSSDNLGKGDRSRNTNGSFRHQSNEKSINEASSNPLSKIKNLRIRNINRVIIGNLNINSLPNKFDQLKEIVLKHIDILIITETKLDDTFPNTQFSIEGFSPPFRLDRNRNGGGVMIYVRENIPCKLLNKHVFSDDIEGLFVELNFRKCKWLLFGTYHPPTQNDEYFFEM